MWLKVAILICCAVASVLADEDIITKSRPGHEYVDIRSSVGEARAIPIEEFVTSHKIPEGLIKPNDDEDADSEEVEIAKDVVKKIQNLDTKVHEIDNINQSLEPSGSDDYERNNSKRQARVDLENFSDVGVLQEEGIRKIDTYRSKDEENEKEAIIPGVKVSAEYSTTMVPLLTTEREYRSFDFVPVNIIREDSKDGWTPYSNRNFDDLGDVSLVPAGSNSRIQVKKGPNGKDYEYEYVYYYYDEEEEGKASASTNNQQESPSRTTSSPRRTGGNSNRSKYTNVERSSTVEPATNEVIPNRNGNRGRLLGENDDVSEERLPTNTRFPPRALSRSNHNSGTTEPSRARGNRPRPSLDLVDSSSFRTHPEGPEFPQSLPKGPVRFLGVTPNENAADEKPATRVRGRPHRIQEPAPVVEASEDVVPVTRRRPISEPAVEIELNRGQPSRPALPADDEDDNDEVTESSSLPTLLESDRTNFDDKHAPADSTPEATTFETPTTEYPSAMDKVALDLYAFQQGQSNLVDAAASVEDSNESSTLEDENITTDLPTTTEEISTTTTEAMTTTTTTEATTTTTTTTEAPTTTSQVPTGRGKFRRPGIPNGAGTRNRFKSSGNGNGSGTTTTTEVPAEPTPRNRNRYGGSSSGGFKRPRPSQKQPIDEEIQKDSTSNVNAEKPAAGRNRYRGAAATSRSPVSTTSAPSTPSSSSNGNSGISRPSLNKLSVNRRRGRPTTVSPATSEESHESGENSQNGQTDVAHNAPTTPKSPIKARLPGIGGRPVRPGARVNLRPRPGQATTTTTIAPEVTEGSVEEPAGEGTEEETHEAPAETSPPARQTTVNPLNKLRSRNRLQVQPKTTTRAPVSVSHRRSPLLPRRKTTEAPVTETTEEEVVDEAAPETISEIEATEATLPETSTAASTKHEETRGLGGLLAPRRRIPSRRPGQLVSRE